MIFKRENVVANSLVPTSLLWKEVTVTKSDTLKNGTLLLVDGSEATDNDITSGLVSYIVDDNFLDDVSVGTQLSVRVVAFLKGAIYNEKVLKVGGQPLTEEQLSDLGLRYSGFSYVKVIRDLPELKITFDDTGWTGNASNLSSLTLEGDFLSSWGSLTKTSLLEVNQADDVYSVQVDYGDDPLWSLSGGYVELETGATDTSFRGGLVGYDNDFYLGKQWRCVSFDDLSDRGIVDGQSVSFRLDNVLYYPEVLTGKPKIRTAIFKNARGIPTIVPTFDDGGRGIMDDIQYIIDKEIVGTIYMPWAFVGQAGKFTVEDLKTLKDLGWDIQLDGTRDDTSMLGRADVDTIKAEIQEGISWAQSNGLGTPRHICYPFGFHRDPTIQQTRQDAACTVGSPVITMADTSGITSGMRVVHRNFPQNTVVVSVDSGTQLTVSENASLTSDNGATMASTDDHARFVDVSSKFYTNTIPQALSEIGIVTGRTTVENFIHTKYGVDAKQAMVLPSYVSVVSGAEPALNREQVWIEAAKRYGSTVFVTFHDVTGSTDSLNTTWTTFKQWFDVMCSERDLGNIEITTVDKVYRRDFKELV